MVEGYPARGAYGSDYYYLPVERWESANEFGRAIYLWDQKAAGFDLHLYDWGGSYSRIFNCNVVLDNIDEAALESLTESDRRYTKGSALFFRGWSFFHLAEIFAPPYDAEQDAPQLGIPLRLSADINDETKRSTLKETYNRIIKDLEHAANMLPTNSAYPIQPNKAIAYGALAKVYLVLGDYKLAADYADSCLAISPDLLDYNTLSPTEPNPFGVFNKEVLLHAAMGNFSTTILYPSVAIVDSNLYGSYAENDLRKLMFFEENKDGTFSFEGNYTGNTSLLFTGIATDEIYLLRAEANARIGKKTEALRDLNSLLEKRWKQGTFEPIAMDNLEDLLTLILEERRKELAFRGGIRWSDIRRLNKDPRFAITLRRKLNGEIFELKPDDPRYTFHIPWEIIDLTGIEQNK